MIAVPTYAIDAGVSYQCHPHHRNGNRNKSQWSINPPEEVACFQKTWDEDWFADDIGWGIHLVSAVANYLGIARDRTTQLIVAKFVCKNKQSEWHGYPADHTTSADRPADEILGRWLADQSLPPAKIRKLQKGEPCSL